MTSKVFTITPAGDVPAIRLPDPARVFLDRAERFDALAKDHSLGEWLAFLGRLSRAQHEALEEVADVGLPDADELDRARTHGMPPLTAASYKRPPAWRAALGRIVEALQQDAPEGLRDTIHHTVQEREHFRNLLALGLTDSFRMFEQPPKSFSWWDYRMLGYPKNRGLRIDHILVSQALQPKVRGCLIDRVPRKWEKPSDHTPVVVELAD